MSLFEEASLVITPNAFKAGKLYAVKGADMVVTRATSATRVNANGVIETVGSNVPLIDHTGGGCPTILVQPQRTNLVTRSDNFNSGAWIITGSVLSDVSVSPDGTTNADKLVDGLTDGGLIRSLSTNASSYTYSIFAKKAERSQIILNSSLGGATFNLNDGSVVSADSGFNASTIYYGNGWYRCLVTYTSILATYNFVYACRGSETIVNGTTGIFIWGAQLEAGSYATSYIPTTSAAVTRNADVISKTGISSLIGQTEGTMFLDVKAQLNNADEQDFSISDGTTNNRAFIRLASSGVIRAIGVFAGNTEFNIGSTPYTTGTRYKIALAYKNNDVVLYINGTNVASTNTTTISGTLSRLGFDVFTNGAQTIVSPINSASLWKTRLTNAELAELTTI